MSKLENIRAKVFTPESINRTLSYWRFKAKKIVFTNGCFDILHRGHIEYLAKAKDEGDLLIIGLNTDSSVKKIKGPNRPVNAQDDRALMLASLSFVDAVVLFDEETPYELIKQIQPDVLVKGADYEQKEIVGADIVIAKGGEVKTIELVEGYSTSSIIRAIANGSNYDVC